MDNLNNRPVFDDGSRMNIFSSKLRNIQLQNNNLGGVNYEELKYQQECEHNETHIRDRKRTLDAQPTFQSSGSCVSYMNDSPDGYNKQAYSDRQSTFSRDSDNWKGSPFSTNSFSAFDVDEQFRLIAM